MRPQASVSTRPDHTVLTAWREGVAQASRDPNLKQQLWQRQSELLPRFEEHYYKLSALPRRIRRSLQRQWRKSLAGIALLLVLGAEPAIAATINVGGACTLVRAIRSANADTAVGGCTAGSGADRIVLPAGSTQTLTTVNNTVYGASGLPVIRSVMTIDGNGSTIRRASGAPAFRIITVGSDGNLTLQETTVRGGKASEDSDGGGVLNRGRLTVTNSTISGNSTSGSVRNFVCEPVHQSMKWNRSPNCIANCALACCQGMGGFFHLASTFLSTK